MNASAPITFAIRDLQTGCEIIARIPLANPQQAEADLDRFLDCLQALPPESETYFRLLEHARLPIAFVTEELAKRYLNKPIPLGDLEESLFQKVVGLWLKTAKAYAHCAESDASDENDPSHAQRVAMILHRCIHHTGMAIIEHQRARREIPWGLWLDLHGYYASAEEWGIATLTIADALESLGRSTHCAAAYISVLLCDMAGCYSLSVREQLLVRRWASYWAPLVSLHPASPGDALPPFVVDLMQDLALRPVTDCLQTDHLRRLDTSRLAMQITQIRHQLRQRIPPAQLALGEDCTAGQCNRLLEHLSRPWSQARAPRKFRRHATSGTTKLCTGFEEMHYYISGAEFEQPLNVRTYSRREFESLFAFRHQEDPQQILQVRKEQLAYTVDTWEVVNQSANGFRLVRSVSGKKMAHGQLLALCPQDGGKYILAQTTWLMQEKGGGLIAGIRALPGIPMAIAARPIDPDGTEPGKYQRAFILPAVPSVGAEQSLVVPQSWYRNGRKVEIFTDGMWQVRLLGVLDEGPDFERVSFELG
jgi:cyclic-di-GMP-binding protein